MSTILVTGSNGCVGKALQHNIINKENSWVFLDRHSCDLTNREQTIELFKLIKPDMIVHLAAYVPGFYNINKVNSFNINVRINENVLEAANLANVNKGLFCLSVNMFSETLNTFPLNESMIFDGALGGNFSGYAYSKRMLALQCKNYNEQYGRQYFGIIPCNIYGPHDNMESGRLIPNLILKFKEAIKNNTDVILNGSGLPLRQFIYSNDLAKIIERLIMHYENTNSIICCDDLEISITSLADKIGNILNFKNEIKFDVSKPDGVFKKTVSNNYLKTILPQISFTSLDDGLKETIKYMETV